MRVILWTLNKKKFYLDILAISSIHHTRYAVRTRLDVVRGNCNL